MSSPTTRTYERLSWGAFILGMITLILMVVFFD
jgi:hypothetical protein